MIKRLLTPGPCYSLLTHFLLTAAWTLLPATVYVITSMP